MKINFLTASWQNLLAVNWEVDPELLKKYVPRGTSLDLYEGKAYISLVAFNFKYNKFLGLIPTIPYSFPEVNLRFYIKRETPEGTKKAVAFIREFVPSALIAFFARFFYNERYANIGLSFSEQNASYSWSLKQSGKECKIECKIPEGMKQLAENKLAHFIFEHYYGYAAQPDASTLEYAVQHKQWRFSEVENFKIDPEIISFFDPEFSTVLSSKPVSVYLADGSDVNVLFPSRFFTPLPATDKKGWVLYDGTCGFCSWWIPYWQKSIEKAGYSSAALQEPWVKEALNMPESDINNDIRLLLCDGTLISGSEAYLYGMRQVAWSRPFGLLLSMPVLRHIVWLFYKIFNRNRFLVSRVCGFRPQIKS